MVLWVTSSTAAELEMRAGTMGKDAVSELILRAGQSNAEPVVETDEARFAAVPVEISRAAFECLGDRWAGVNDDHTIRLFLRSVEPGR